MSDYLKSNRDEVQRFRNKAEEGFDWDHYLQFVAHLEGKSVSEIENRTRRAIRWNKAFGSQSLAGLLIKVC